MKPTIRLIRTLLWKTYYRIFYKQSYSQKLYSAMCISNNLIASTHGKISHFYDIDGTLIRGWHKHIKFNSKHSVHQHIQNINSYETVY